MALDASKAREAMMMLQGQERFALSSLPFVGAANRYARDTESRGAHGPCRARRKEAFGRVEFVHVHKRIFNLNKRA